MPILRLVLEYCSSLLSMLPTIQIKSHSAPRLHSEAQTDGGVVICDHDSDVASLKMELKEIKARSQQRLSNQRRLDWAELKHLRKERDDLRRDQEIWQSEKHKLHHQLEEYGATRERVQRLCKEADEHARRFAALEKKYTETADLLRVRSVELQDAQKFLRRIDSISDAEVLRMLQNLNSVIYQTAAHIADSTSFCGARGDPSRHSLELDVGKALTARVGQEMVDILLSRTHSGDPTVVQVALQACMIMFAGGIIMAWTFEPDRLFERIYARMRFSESAPVSGRWRALSRSYLGSLPDHEALSNWAQEQLIGQLANVLFVSGAHGATHPRELFDIVKSKFSDNVKTVVELSLDLQKLVGEDIISCDYEPTLIAFGIPFDKEKMSDGFGYGKVEKVKRSAAAKVLCTIEMGMQRVEKRESEELHVVVLSKPSVVLETMMAELQEISGY